MDQASYLPCLGSPSPPPERLHCPKPENSLFQSDTKFPVQEFGVLTRSWPVADLIAPPAVQSGPFAVPCLVRLQTLFIARMGYF